MDTLGPEGGQWVSTHTQAYATALPNGMAWHAGVSKELLSTVGPRQVPSDSKATESMKDKALR